MCKGCSGPIPLRLGPGRPRDYCQVCRPGHNPNPRKPSGVIKARSITAKCSVCSQPRPYHPSVHGGDIVCHPCRRVARKERERLKRLDQERKRLDRELRRMLNPLRYRSGRGGMGARPYRRNRAQVLAESDLCGLCGHPGAKTCDHKTSDRDWPRDEHGKRLPGFDDVENLQPAHGSMGNTGEVNYCPTCGAACNQRKGANEVNASR